MGTTATHMPPFSQPIADPKTGLASLNMGLWQQELLRARQAWIPFTPTTANLTAITINDCAFQTLGKLVTVRIAITGTSNGGFFTVQLPFKAKAQSQTFSVFNNALNFAGAASLGADLITLTILKYDGTAPGNGVVQGWVISGTYEAQ